MLSSWDVAQSSYDVCLVSAQSSLEVVQSSYDVCLVSAQSSWDAAQSSYDVSLVSGYTYKRGQVIENIYLEQLLVLTNQIIIDNKAKKRRGFSL